MSSEKELLQTVLTESLEQFALIFGDPPPVGGPPSSSSPPYLCVQVALSVAGTAYGVSVAAPQDVCRDMAANVLGASLADVTEEQSRDALKELGNILAGNWAEQWSGDGADCSISVPSLLPADAVAVAELAADGATVSLVVDDQMLYGRIVRR